MKLASRIIKVSFSEHTVRVYQAFGREIAIPALEAGKFVPPFKMSRMTWIKPSFNWMMYRSAYGTKEGQEYVLAIDIRRNGFDWALENAVLSTYRPEVHGSIEDWKRQLKQSPVRVQWDPARNWRAGEINTERAIQIGLSNDAVCRYVGEWIVSITDVTPIAHSLAQSRDSRTPPASKPDDLEVIYPVLQIDPISVTVGSTQPRRQRCRGDRAWRIWESVAKIVNWNLILVFFITTT